MNKKKYMYMWIGCIFIALVAILIVRRINTPYYDTSIVAKAAEERDREITEKIKEDDNFDFWVLNEIDIYADELVGRETPKDNTYSVVMDTTLEKCQRNFKDAVNMYKLESDYITPNTMADENGSFEYIYSAAFGDMEGCERITSEQFLSTLETNIDNESKKDIDYLIENHNEVIYTRKLKNQKEIDKYYGNASNDQKLLIAYYLDFGWFDSQYVRIKRNDIVIENSIAEILESENDKESTLNGALVELDKILNKLNMKYIVKNISVREMKNDQYVLLNSGNESYMEYYFLFNSFVDEIEVLSNNDEIRGIYPIVSHENSQKVRFVNNTLNHAEIWKNHPSELLCTVDVKSNATDIYEQFEKYLEEHDNKRTYEEIHVNDIGIKYLVSKGNLYPVYTVTTTNYEYLEENDNWTRRTIDYTFPIEGIDYSDMQD